MENSSQIKEIIQKNEKFLDKVALEVAKKYIEFQPPTSDKDCLSISTIAYQQALAMLDVKLTLSSLIPKTKFLLNFRNPHKNQTDE